MSEKSTPSVRFDGFTNDWEQRQASHNVPAVRFTADDGSDFPEWEQKKLGEIFTERVERSSTGELISVTINQGVVKSSDLDRRDNSSSDKSNYKVVRVGDIAYNSMRMWQGASGASQYSGILSPAYTVVIPRKGQDVSFWEYQFKSDLMLYRFTINSQGLTSDTWNLKYPLFSKISVQVPSFPEQKKIAALLSSADEALALCQRKLDLLTQAKKALMQQIFSQKLRFKADDGSDYPAWEEKKLGDITDNYDSLRVPVTQSERTPGDVPYYGANGIQDYVSGFTHEGEFVLLPEDGASDTKHYPAWVIQRKAWVNNHAHVLRGKEDLLDNYFLAYRITTMDISKYLVGGGRAKLNAETLTSLNLVIPSLPEQKKIAACLSSADALIDQARVELEQWQDVKKSLLQQMFV